jgi:hypothetical protein
VLTSAPPKVWCRCANCGERRALLYYENPRVAKLERELSEQQTLAAINASGCDRALEQMELATFTIEAQTARIVALEGGIVAENARVVREHNELRAARDAAEVAFARFAHEVAEALGGLSNEGTLNRIRALVAAAARC